MTSNKSTSAFGDQGVFLKKHPLEPQKLLEKCIAKVFALTVIPSQLQRIHGTPAPFDSSKGLSA